MTSENMKNEVNRIGRVKSDKMDKSIVVTVERKVMHPIYRKILKRYTNITAHDENNEARIGDLVEVSFARPISKRKRWRLVSVLEAVTVAGSTAAGSTAAGSTGGAE